MKNWVWLAYIPVEIWLQIPYKYFWLMIVSNSAVMSAAVTTYWTKNFTQKFYTKMKKMAVLLIKLHVFQCQGGFQLEFVSYKSHDLL